MTKRIEVSTGGRASLSADKEAVQQMTKRIEVPINVFRAIQAAQVALCGVLLGLMALRWPVAAGVVLAVAVCVVMWVAIVKVVTSGHRPLPKPVCDAGATVDGRAVESVEVMQP